MKRFLDAFYNWRRTRAKRKALRALGIDPKTIVGRIEIKDNLVNGKQVPDYSDNDWDRYRRH